MKAQITVYFKDGILDPQGQTIQQSLASMGFAGVKQLRAGKAFDVELESMAPGDAMKQLSQMCDRLLVNPTIEKYQIELK